MAGDPLRDAFRALLITIKTEQSITWSTRDTLNSTEEIPAQTPYLELVFDGGDERQGTFGAPGGNLHDEAGQVRLNIVMPLGAEQAQGEAYGRKLRNAFRTRRYQPFQTSEGRDVFIDAVSPLGSGEEEGGMWVETLGLSYHTDNVG